MGSAQRALIAGGPSLFLRELPTLVAGDKSSQYKAITLYTGIGQHGPSRDVSVVRDSHHVATDALSSHKRECWGAPGLSFVEKSAARLIEQRKTLTRLTRPRRSEQAGSNNWNCTGGRNLYPPRSFPTTSRSVERE